MDEWPSETPEPKTSAKRRSRSQKSLPAAPPLALPPAQPSSPAVGFKVQVFYLAAQSSRMPKAPVRDDLWFATYPIIPRVGDCLFHDGAYYQVARVFLYENMALGWAADIEVTFLGRR